MRTATNETRARQLADLTAWHGEAKAKAIMTRNVAFDLRYVAGQMGVSETLRNRIDAAHRRLSIAAQ